MTCKQAQEVLLQSLANPILHNGTTFEETTKMVDGVEVKVSSITPYETFRKVMEQDYYASLEEILHTINACSHVEIYPDVFGLAPNSSEMSDAMDVARGGQFLSIPSQYPEEGWYHYDDWTCDYECMAMEYLYWCIVSDMGILDHPQTCNGIYNEWELCTPELFESTDISMHAIVNNPEYKLPQLAPDGNYCPNNLIVGDINGDSIVNILDVIQTVNMVLGVTEVNLIADLNSDSIVNVIDIIGIVNIIING